MEERAREPIGARIQRLRDEQQLSAYKLSVGSGVDIRSVNEIEAGKVRPRGVTLRKLAKRLEITLSELTDGTDAERVSRSYTMPEDWTGRRCKWLECRRFKNHRSIKLCCQDCPERWHCEDRCQNHPDRCRGAITKGGMA